MAKVWRPKPANCAVQMRKETVIEHFAGLETFLYVKHKARTFILNF